MINDLVYMTDSHEYQTNDILLDKINQIKLYCTQTDFVVDFDDYIGDWLGQKFDNFCLWQLSPNTSGPFSYEFLILTKSLSKYIKTSKKMKLFRSINGFTDKNSLFLGLYNKSTNVFFDPNSDGKEYIIRVLSSTNNLLKIAENNSIFLKYRIYNVYDVCNEGDH